MEEQNLSEEMVEVAEQPTQEVETTNENNPQVVETDTVEENSSRDYERDSAFATMRKKLEQYEKDMESAKAEHKKLTDALGLYGFKGQDTDDIVDQANANYYGRTVEEVRKERLEAAQRIAEENNLKDKLKYYEEKEIDDMMKRDLKEIQKLNPEIKNMNQMPKEYFDLISKGVSGIKAYKLLELEGLFKSATQRAEQEAVKKLQANSKASVGSVDSGKVEPVSYANMSDAEFDKLLAKVKRGEMTAT